MDKIQAVLARVLGSATMCDYSPKAHEQMKVDSYNSSVGNRNEEDGYNCPFCKNKGTVAKLVDRGDGTYTSEYGDCRCADMRRSILRMKRSGLTDAIKDYTFEKYQDNEPWQKSLKSAAMEYAQNPSGWFFLGGQSGAGKTHLCTAICREFLYSGRQVVYMLWRDEIMRIKAATTEADEYGGLIERFKKAEVLYIDDFFKTGNAAEGNPPKPTSADINAAYEIINYRSLNPSLLTIISSELTEDGLLDIDEALGGRIIERSKSFSIAKDRRRNYRLRKAVTL